MADYDIFNGDADGICALIQLRLAEPRSACIVTGVKRDIALLDRVEPQQGDRLTVLDVSMDKNRAGLMAALERGASVEYLDHHFAGDIPTHARLTAMINTASDVCTSMLANEKLRGAYVEWAIVGAFGDNLRKSALRLSQPLALSDNAIQKMENLGIYINYNAYGASISDLHFAPDALYQKLSPHKTPAAFLAEDPDTYSLLEQGYLGDMQRAERAPTIFEQAHASVTMLPDEAWARRISGVYGNRLANEHPDRAHAVVTERKDQGYLISVRAPLNNKTGADEICRQFPTGGGRKGAAGVNDLPVDMLDDFIQTLSAFYRQTDA